jgi:NAD(P)-dependent dehydrogenase (short-subunit alcohol dehydrogenase family)
MKRTWLITGCSRGLGRALADRVIASGDYLVATARDPKTLADIVASGAGRVVAQALDVTTPTPREQRSRWRSSALAASTSSSARRTPGLAHDQCVDRLPPLGPHLSRGCYERQS